MFELDGLNEFSCVGAMLNNQSELSEQEKRERKFMYIEGLVRFLELYAQNEIGDVEIDIEKINLWVNSPYFENVDLYQITSIEKVYEMLTADLIDRNIPLYRFLKLDDYKLRLFETEHREQLIRDFDTDCKNYQCLKCIWYTVEETAFGRCSKCNCDTAALAGQFHTVRRGYHDITDNANRNCVYVTTVENYDEFVDKYIEHNVHITHNFGHNGRISLRESAENYRKLWIQKLENLDNSYIPTFIPDAYKTLLTEEFDLMNDLARVFGNKQGLRDMQQNLRQAIFLEAMIKFVEIFAQTEIGSDYYANISAIAKYVRHEGTFTFTSKDEIYSQLERMIIDDEDFAKKFVKRKPI